MSPETVAPSGPLTTHIRDVDVGADGTLWLVTERVESAGFAAVGQLADGAWTSFRTDDATLDSRAARSSRPRSRPTAPSTAAPGRRRHGLPRRRRDHLPRDQLVAARRPGAPGFVVVRDVGFEGETAWVLNSSGLPMHRFDGDTWQGFRYPAGIRSTARAAEHRHRRVRPEVARAGRQRPTVWDTGDDPTPATDDRAVRFTGSAAQGTGLPDPTVRDVVVDAQGRVWLGTERGVAYVFSPGSAFAGDPRARDAPVAALGSTTAKRRVPPARRRRAGPRGGPGRPGLGRRPPAGPTSSTPPATPSSRTITAETSPLPATTCSRSPWTPLDGRVFYVTSEGLSSVTGDATRFAVRGSDPGDGALALPPGLGPGGRGRDGPGRGRPPTSAC